MASLDAKAGFEEVMLLSEVIDALRTLLETKSEQEGLVVLLDALQFVLQDECACGHHIDDVTTSLAAMYSKMATTTSLTLQSSTLYAQRLAELQLKLHTVYQVQESHNQLKKRADESALETTNATVAELHRKMAELRREIALRTASDAMQAAAPAPAAQAPSQAAAQHQILPPLQQEPDQHSPQQPQQTVLPATPHKGKRRKRKADSAANTGAISTTPIHPPPQ